MSLPRSRAFGLSDIGFVRDRNEDQFLIADLQKSMVIHHSSLSIEDETRLFSSAQGQLLLVADGMGGEAAGDRASELTVDTITKHVLQTMPWFFRLHQINDEDLKRELLTAVMACENAVHSESESNPEELGMGTTLTMSYVLWPSMYVVHVGDSRCYVLRNGQLRQITRDQTYAQLLVEDGLTDPLSAQASKYSHMLMSSIGHGPDRLQPDVYQAELKIGDTVVLCTDGLTKAVSNEKMVKILEDAENEEYACYELVAAANASGGTDDITVVVSRYFD